MGQVALMRSARAVMKNSRLASGKGLPLATSSLLATATSQPTSGRPLPLETSSLLATATSQPTSGRPLPPETSSFLATATSRVVLRRVHNLRVADPCHPKRPRPSSRGHRSSRSRRRPPETGAQVLVFGRCSPATLAAFRRRPELRKGDDRPPPSSARRALRRRWPAAPPAQAHPTWPARPPRPP